MEPERQGKAQSLMRFSNGSRADEKANNVQTMEGQLVRRQREANTLLRPESVGVLVYSGKRISHD